MNILEVLLIKLLLQREAYTKYISYINKDYYKDNYIEIYKVLVVLDDMHSRREEDAEYSVDDLEVSFFIYYPAMKQVDKDFYVSLFNKLRDTTVTEQIGRDALEQHRQRSIAFSLAATAFKVSEGKESFENLTTQSKELTDTSPIEEDIKFVTDDLEELYEHTVKAPGLRWRLETLNKVLGSLRKGDFGFLFARPEVGKTTILASEGSFMAEQIPDGKFLLHFSNEEAGDKVKVRYYQASLGLTAMELFADRRRNMEEFMYRTGGRIKIFDAGAIHRRDVEKTIAQYPPGLIIFDSIDKLKGWKEDRDDLVYKEIYQWARELAKEHCPVIGVCHAAVSGEGKKYLTMDDVAYAKTAKQGEADWILGIGATTREGMENIRHFNAPKNKLFGDEDSIPELRHGSVDVVIRPECARYEDLLEFK